MNKRGIDIFVSRRRTRKQIFIRACGAYFFSFIAFFYTPLLMLAFDIPHLLPALDSLSLRVAYIYDDAYYAFPRGSYLLYSNFLGFVSMPLPFNGLNDFSDHLSQGFKINFFIFGISTIICSFGALIFGIFKGALEIIKSSQDGIPKQNFLLKSMALSAGFFFILFCILLTDQFDPYVAVTQILFLSVIGFLGPFLIKDQISS
jgi:hypothetical protein